MYKLTAGFFFFIGIKNNNDGRAGQMLYVPRKRVNTLYTSLVNVIRNSNSFSETNSIDSLVQFAKFWKGAGRGCVTWETYLTNTPFFDKSLTLALKDHMPLEWPKNVGQRFWISLDGEKWGICVKFKSPQAKQKCTMQFKDKNASDSKHDWKQFPSHRRYGNT